RRRQRSDADPAGADSSERPETISIHLEERTDAQVGNASGDRRFVGPLFAAVVRPRDHDLLAFRAALELERYEWILGDGGPPLRGEDRLAVAGRRHVLNEPGGNHVALCVLPL